MGLHRVGAFTLPGSRNLYNKKNGCRSEAEGFKGWNWRDVRGSVRSLEDPQGDAPVSPGRLLKRHAQEFDLVLVAVALQLLEDGSVVFMELRPILPRVQGLHRQPTLHRCQAHAGVSPPHSRQPSSASDLGSNIGLVAREDASAKGRPEAAVVGAGRRQCSRLVDAEIRDVVRALVDSPWATRAWLRQRPPSARRFLNLTEGVGVGCRRICLRHWWLHGWSGRISQATLTR